MQKEHFANLSVIITGASLGIGRELALQLAEQGARLTLAARNTDQLNQVAELCRQKGGKAIVVTTDISQESQCQALIMEAIKEYKQIDILINNAGVGDALGFDGIKSPVYAKSVMDINFWGSIFCTYYALPYLKQSKGRIIVMNSGAGLFPATPSIFYCASKHALAGFFDALRMEIEDSDVTVTTIYPHWVATGISTRAIGSDGKISPFEKDATSVQKCAKIVLKAVEGRKRDVYVKAIIKIGCLLRPFFPKTIDRLVRRSFDYKSYRKGNP